MAVSIYTELVFSGLTANVLSKRVLHVNGDNLPVGRLVLRKLAEIHHFERDPHIDHGQTSQDLDLLHLSNEAGPIAR